MKTLALLTVLGALVAATTASAATPTQYRATMNGICRSYTPKLKQVEKTMTGSGNDQVAYAAALRKFLGLGLAQDVKLEAVPVPAALRARMTPIIALMKKIDVHVRAAIAASNGGDQTTLNMEAAAIARLAAPLNPKLDAAGLKACGSQQA